jgi:hypothetical protein
MIAPPAPIATPVKTMSPKKKKRQRKTDPVPYCLII